MTPATASWLRRIFLSGGEGGCNATTGIPFRWASGRGQSVRGHDLRGAPAAPRRGHDSGKGLTMRTLILSDIHGNLPALLAVLAEPHDAVICLGDVVGYGPEPAACVQRLLDEPRLLAVRGNHDRAFLDGSDPGCRPGFRWLAQATAAIATAQLTARERDFLETWPEWLFPSPDGIPAIAVHATPSDTLYRYLDDDAAEWREELASLPVALALVGHTHRQFDLDLGTARVVNPGSVGQPKDGDPRAAYAVLENGTLELRRAEYPVERTLEAYRRTPVPPQAIATLTALLRNGIPEPATV
jgi:putative phosphoesterase